MKRILWFCLLLCLYIAARGQTGYEYDYWFDNDRSTLQTGQSQSSSWQIVADMSQLRETLHTIHVQVRDEAGVTSSPVTRFFVKTADRTAVQGRYWFDDDVENIHVSAQIDGTFDLDLSGIPEGFHTLHYQVLGVNGSVSAIASRSFLKVPQVIGVDYLTCLCMVDDQLYKQERVTPNGGVLAWEFDVSGLSQGFHRAYIQVVTPSGAATSAYSTYFIRTATNTEMGEMKCVYAIDGGDYQTTAGSINGQAYHFDLDVAALDDGLHRLTYMLNNGNGVSTKVQTHFFTKIPLGGNGITQYEYWLNENYDTRHQVMFPERVDPFNLISLLPVETEPIRSTCFQFEIKDGKPMMYAKNDFYLRFYEATGRFVDAAKQFVDYNVEQEVESAGVLQTTQTFQKIEENTVRWYTLQTEPGDTVAFRSSQATSIHLFAPSGKELYKSSGAESVTYGGCHVWETGTYYLAVHDVTGSQSQMTLDYMHMDKYDVVDQDIHTVGNGGCSTITFRGNGFSGLLSVDLIRGQEKITSMEVGHESDAETSVMFDFDGVELGNYDAVFHFGEEDKEVLGCITVEDALPFEFEVDAQFANQFLLSQGITYVFTIRNKSNMTAYNVPIGISIYAADSSSISQIEFTNYDIKKEIAEYLGDDYTPLIDSKIEQKRKLSKDRYYFFEKDSTTFEDGLPYRLNAIVSPSLRPNQQETLKVFIKTNYVGKIAAYLYFYEVDENDVLIKRKFYSRRRSLGETYSAMCAHKAANLQAGIPDGGYPNLKCPGDPPNDGNGGSSNGSNSLDPNDIYGYLSTADSKFAPDTIQQVNYRIEFENDKTFATASAHAVVVKDTLDSHYFDLSSFAPAGIKIGNKDEYLDGTPNFVKTIDMRPAIDAIAQVKGTYDSAKGIATWTFTSLDPMTMEPTDDVMQGFLPVNYDGTSGIGEVSFNIDLKQPLADGTEIPNRAGIVFDQNECIMTPTWTNIIDAVAPTSKVEGTTMEKVNIVTLHMSGSDERSGVWKYTVYVQDGAEAPWYEAGVTDTCVFDFAFMDDIDYGFCVIATDSAGNVEQKELVREAELLTFIAGDVNSDGNVSITDVGVMIDWILGLKPKNLNASAADLNRDGNISITDVGMVVDIILRNGQAGVKERKQLEYQMQRLDPQ